VTDTDDDSSSSSSTGGNVGGSSSGGALSAAGAGRSVFCPVAVDGAQSSGGAEQDMRAAQPSDMRQCDTAPMFSAAVVYARDALTAAALALQQQQQHQSHPAGNDAASSVDGAANGGGAGAGAGGTHVRTPLMLHNPALEGLPPRNMRLLGGLLPPPGGGAAAAGGGGGARRYALQVRAPCMPLPAGQIAGIDGDGDDADDAGGSSNVGRVPAPAAVDATPPAGSAVCIMQQQRGRFECLLSQSGNKKVSGHM
jgi:hypothetical protein